MYKVFVPSSVFVGALDQNRHVTSKGDVVLHTYWQLQRRQILPPCCPQ